MREKRVMQIKRGLMKRAKKLRLGARRTGAYVYGTLRRIVGNPGDSDFTPVVFRTFRGDNSVIALFPYEPGNNDAFTMMSYQHIGQHGIADMGLTASYTRPSKPDEIRPLKEELQRIGYKLKIMSRIPGDAIRVRREKLQRIVRGNPMRSSFDKPTFGPGQAEYRRVDTTTMAGMREAERLHRAGWYQGQVTPFSTTYYRKRALPKSSIARQIRGNPGTRFVFVTIYDKYFNWKTDNNRSGGQPFSSNSELKRLLIKLKSALGLRKDQIEIRDERGLRRNPPMYAHGMMSHRTHGLSLKQMMKLYRMVSSGNPKAVMFARRTLGIPMSESLQQVKAVVYHHVLDLKGKI
ncbi:hypothetical protein EB093_09870 [bacterium]|nr:hypothetical protein [bacterium]